MKPIACIGVVMVMLVCGCSSHPGGCELSKSLEPWRRTDVYFGRSIQPQNRTVTVEEWQAFLDEQVTPVFEGLTYFDAHGRWRDEHGKPVAEETWVLTVLYPAATEKNSLCAIETIAQAYVKRFEQSSVLVEHRAVEAGFVAAAR